MAKPTDREVWLHQNCAPARAGWETPFGLLWGGRWWLCATDSFVLVGVRRRANPGSAREDAPDPSAVLAGPFDGVPVSLSRLKAWAGQPRPLRTIRCTICDAKCEVECDSCHGEGKHACDKCSTKHDCGTCAKTGRRTCTECLGTKRVTLEPKLRAGTIDGIPFNLDLVSRALSGAPSTGHARVAIRPIDGGGELHVRGRDWFVVVMSRRDAPSNAKKFEVTRG